MISGLNGGYLDWQRTNLEAAEDHILEMVDGPGLGVVDKDLLCRLRAILFQNSLYNELICRHL